MANTYKNIVITPNIGNTADPRIQFSGGNTTANTDINLYVYPDANGTLSFEGSAGQLFSITNDLANLLFSVADVSGIPSLEVYANGLVSLAPLGGNVVFGNTSELILSPGTGLYANGGLGTAGQVLHSNGTSVYWAADDNSGGTVTSVASANGIGGGTITATGTLYAVAGNSTVFVNASGIHVNTAALPADGVTSVASGNGILGGTITSTGTLYVDGANGISVDASGVNVLAGNSQLISNATGLWVNQAQIDHDLLLNFASDEHVAHSTVTMTAGNGLTGGGTIAASRTFDVGAGNGISVSADAVAVNGGSTLTVNTAGAHVNSTLSITTLTTSGNITLGGTFSANGSVGSAGQILTSGGTGNAYWQTITLGDITSVTAGDGLTGGGTSGDVTLNVVAANGITVAADSVAVTEGVGLAVNTTGVHVKANTGIVANSTGTFVNATYIGTISSNNASYLGGYAETSFLRYRGSITETTVNDTTTDAARTSGWYTVSYPGASDALLDIGGIGGSTPRIQFRFNYDDSIWVRAARDTETTWDSVTSRGKLLLHSSNFNSYAPTLTGTGASGSWGINITGSAASATTATTATNSTQLGGVAAASYVQNTDSRTLSGNLVFTGTNTTITTDFRVVNSTANVALFSSNGQLLLGSTTPEPGLPTTSGGILQVLGPGGPNSSIGIFANSDSNAPSMRQYRKRATGGTVQAGDSIGVQQFAGWSGTNYRLGARINALIDTGTISDTSMPGYIALETSADGTVAPVERLRVSANGNVGIGNITPAHMLSVGGNARFAGDVTLASNLILGTTTISANGGVGTAGQVLTSSGGSNVYWSTPAAGSTVNVNATYAWTNTHTFAANVNFDAGTLFVDATNNRVGVNTATPDAALQVSGTANVSGVTRFGANVTLAGTLQTISGNVNIDSGVLFVDSTNNRVGVGTTSPDANLSVSGTANISGVTTFSANVLIRSRLSANGGFGSAGQVLTSSGTGANAYWASAAGGGYYKGAASAVGTLASQGQNIFRINANTLNTSTTMVAGENAQATGPLTIASGITLTVQTGARVSIV